MAKKKGKVTVPELVEKGPSEQAAEENEQLRQTEEQEIAETELNTEKKEAKKPLNEAEKTRLAMLEKMSRSGKSPDIDQMKDLRLLRMRKAVTPLSSVEVRELEELEIKSKGGMVEAIPDSGISDADRLAELKERSEI